MAVLGRRALNRALLERQLLLRRHPLDPAAAVEHLVGLQAQEPQAPYVGLWSRLDGFDPVAAGELVERRALVRLLMMRGTVHLVTARDCLALRPVVQRDVRRRVGSAVGRRLAGVDLDELAAAGAALLAERPLAAIEAGRALHERWPAADPQALGLALTACVPAVQVPPRGVWRRSGRALLTTAEAWLDQPLGTSTRPDVLLRRYLAAFGPASASDMRVWSGLSGLRDAVDRLRPGLVAYEDERGRELLDLPGAPLPDPDTPAPVRFLPPFDNVVLGHDDRSRILPPDRLRLVVGGAAFVLVDGFAAATWRMAEGHETARLAVEAFAPLGDDDAAEVDREGRALLRLLAPEAPGHAVDIVPAP